MSVGERRYIVPLAITCMFEIPGRTLGSSYEPPFLFPYCLCVQEGRSAVDRGGGKGGEDGISYTIVTIAAKSTCRVAWDGRGREGEGEFERGSEPR